MDDAKRTAADSLTTGLKSKPYAFDFFQAVRRLDCVDPALPRIGLSSRPQSDPVRFCQNVSLAFAPASLAAYDEATEQNPAKMSVNFFGLLGPSGPMPLAITEFVYDRLHNHKDATLASFLDIFNHRMTCLFYRAWAHNQQVVSHDRRHEDRFALYVGSLFGIGDGSLHNRDALPDVAKLHYSGHFACQRKNAEGLREILEDYFGIPVSIHQFVGRWINLPEKYRCRLGARPSNAQLGSTLILGNRFWECQQTFRITFGPMDFSQYRHFLPGSDSVRRLISWVRNYLGDEFRWELQLILKAVEVPDVSLDGTAQLGWSAWLGAKKLEADADGLVLRSLQKQSASGCEGWASLGRPFSVDREIGRTENSC
ncbi:MAG: type VI secretion system baseplate subunit TssG [Phycisphaerales bacterium]|nr:MAG: type VI secretion system baseplate subunit TssG [Phycisphaerales bacterium]